MKQRIFSLFTALCLCLTLLPTTAFAEGENNSNGIGGILPGGDSVSYLYYDTEAKEMKSGSIDFGKYTTVSSEINEWGTDGTDKWYVVPKDTTVTIDGTVTLNGNVHLILCDGAELTVTGGIKGGKNYSMTIYAQSNDTGKLTVSGGFCDGDYAYGMDFGNLLIINGGSISVDGINGEGKVGNAGISVQQMIINGGMVISTVGTGALYNYGIYCSELTVTNGKIRIDQGEGKQNPTSFGYAIISGGIFTGDICVGSANTHLTGGAFTKLSILGNNGTIAELPDSGYTYQSTEGENTMYRLADFKDETSIENVTVVKCEHEEYNSTTGKCVYCGMPLVRLNDTLTPLDDALTVAKAKDSITLLTNVSEDIICTSKNFTLDLNGNTLSALTVSGTAIKVRDGEGGGKIQKLNTTDGVKVVDLLESGYTFWRKGNNVWYDNTHNGDSTNVWEVEVKATPTVTITASTYSCTYGYAAENAPTFTADTDGNTATYKWYVNGTEQTGKTGSTFTFPTGNTANTYTVKCEANVTGYGVVSDEVTVTVNKATPTYTAPTANTLIYNNDEQELVSAETVPTGCTMQYKLSENGTWSDAIPKAKNASTYTVYWQIVGGTNYEDVTNTTPVQVSIARKPVTPTVTLDNSNFDYDGTAKTPAVTVKDSETTIPTSEYTVSYADNINAGDATVTVTDKTGGNYAVETAATDFKINRATYNGTTTATGSAKYGASNSVDLSGLIMSGGKATIDTATNDNNVLDSYSITDDTSLYFAFRDTATVGATETITVNVSDCTNYKDYTLAVTLTVNAKNVPTVTAPTAKTLTYNGSDQTLINAATTTGGTLQYSLDGNDWSTELPTGKAATTYTVYYKVDGGTDYADVAANSIPVTIGKKAVAVKPKSYTITKGSTIPAFALEYDGLVSGESLITSATPTFTCYESEGGAEVSTSTAAGSYTITWTNPDDFNFTGETNYDVSKVETGTLTINNKPSGNGGGGSSSNTTSTTVKNPDGSTTTTVTDKKTGTVTATTTTPNGTTSTTVTDKDGNSTTTVSVSKKDAQSGETVTLPVDEVKPTTKSENATEITVKVPSGGATIEVPVKNPTPGTVIVIVDKDGNETVIPTTKQTENGVSITLTEDATIKVIENSKDFSDVRSSDYFDKAVDWASSRGITGGNSATTFGPHDSCTRAQLVTFLWRAAGQPEAANESGMSDVATNSYYTDAVHWAFDNGIVGGYGNGLFGSEDTITREQMAVILYRFARHTGMDTTQGGMSVREYKDYESVSDYAVAAIQWAVNAGVMQGYDGNLMPGQPCTRAQIVTMLYRLLGA